MFGDAYDVRHVRLAKILTVSTFNIILELSFGTYQNLFRNLLLCKRLTLHIETYI